VNAAVSVHSSCPTVLRELCRLSARIGADPTLVQGGGGNTSLKEEGVLWVKASGTWLAEAQSKPIFVALDLQGVRAAITAGEADPVTDHVIDSTTGRPSIETTLHALMPHRVVLHVHSVAALAWAIRKDGEAALAAPLSGLNWAWVDYARPGISLTRAVVGMASKESDVIVLGNHGLVVGGRDESDAERRLAEVEWRLARPSRIALRPEPLEHDGEWAPAAVPGLHAVAWDPGAYDLVTGGTLYPDHAVFLGPAVIGAEANEPLDIAARRHQDRFGAPGVIALRRNQGAFVRGDVSRGALEMMRALALVASRAFVNAPIRYLDSREALALMNWDAEIYRRVARA